MRKSARTLHKEVQQNPSASPTALHLSGTATRRRNLLIRAAVACVFAAAAYFGAAASLYSLCPLQMAWSVSPADFSRRAAFVRESCSFGGSNFWVHVRDPAGDASRWRLIGGPYATDGSVKLRRALWSRDGSVLAVEADVGEPSGKHFRSGFDTFLVEAYDFEQHQRLPRRQTRRATHSAIRTLMKQRGRQGAVAFASPFAVTRDIGWLQSRQFVH